MTDTATGKLHRYETPGEIGNGSSATVYPTSGRLNTILDHEILDRDRLAMARNARRRPTLSWPSCLFAAFAFQTPPSHLGLA